MVVTVKRDSFGIFVDDQGMSRMVNRFTFANDTTKLEVQVVSYGVTITAIKQPDRNGQLADIVMGFDNMDGYQLPQNPYFGSSVGRVANRIGNARFTIGNTEFKVSANLGKHCLHGGFKAFDKVLWNDYVDGNRVIFTYLSADGEEGFPGATLNTITCELKENGIFEMEMKATTTRPTPINLTNHSYFNLAGHGAGLQELKNHTIQINGSKYTLTNKDSIPTGEISNVQGTVYDIRAESKIGDLFANNPEGYDNNWCLKDSASDEILLVAKVTHPGSGRVLEVFSNESGCQFYTANGLPAPGGTEKLNGKGGVPYTKQGSLCLETQNYPDAVNHANFPKSVFYPGEEYKQVIRYKFSVMK